MRAKRTFIDWRRPALAAVVDFVCTEYLDDGVVDLSSVIVVTPGGRAGRRFLELLAERTEGRNAAPQILTPKDLPERLYQLKRPLADDLTQQFAWVEALRGLREEQMRSIVGHPPADGDIQARLEIGELLGKVHRELAADLKSFRDVAALPLIHAARESTRWQSLADAQDRYLAILDQLDLWDRQTARLVAIERKEPATDCDILLIGLADMNHTLRAMLEQVSDRVHVFVHAPESLAARFDQFGVLIPDAWESAPIPLEEDWLAFVDRPTDQAAAVVEFVRRQAEEGAAVEDVVIGLADESLASPVRVGLEERGVATRWIGGRTVGGSSVAQLLDAIASRLESDLTSVTCELIRHPDIARRLGQEGLPAGWLAMVDQAVAEHAPRRLGGGSGDDRNLDVSRAVAELVEQLVKPLRGSARPLGDWATPICRLLEEIYADREFGDGEADQRERQALELLRDALLEQSDVPESLSPATSASAAIRLALESKAGELLRPESRLDAVELIGWLELPLDDAPALVVCGLNDGFVPSSLNSDMFLPNGLRELLGLEDNRRRYSRDAYALSVLIHSRRSVKLVSGRHNAQGDPLLPSRLVFATDEKTMAHRVVKAFEPTAQEAPAQERRESGLHVPRPRTDIEVTKLNVTAFRDYIACPYRFYLKHIEKLRSVADLEGELTAANFGTLIHSALLQWAKSDAKDATDPLEVKRVVEEAFDASADRMFDDEPLPAVKLQLEQARLRLRAFAEWQALHRRAGWRVQYWEKNVSRELVLESGRTLTIIGQIDRIDYHADRDEWLIIDYKTGDAGDTPEKVHLQSGEWVDLQLPLYRFLAGVLDLPGDAAVAYVALGKEPPKDPTELLKRASWTPDQFAQANWKIFRIAEDVAAGRFWPPAKHPPTFDDFSAIVQEGVFGREAFL